MSVRICVTGIGVYSAIGEDLATFTANLATGSSGIRQYDDIIAGQSIWAGLVADEDSDVPFGAAELEHADRAAKLAIHAARQAWQDAFPEGFNPSRERVGLVFGTSHGGRSQLDEYIERKSGADEVQHARNVMIKSPHYQQTEAVAFRLQIHGPVATVSTACSSGGAALAYAFELLQSGKADYMFAGGMDGFSKLTWAGFRALGAISHGPCAPFSAQIGISLGEGAGVVVLERLEHARQRGANIHAEMLGYGLSWDCHHITEPQPAGEGLQRAIVMAARNSRITAADVDYISLHGTGTRANDGPESLAVEAFFGPKGEAPPGSASKSLLGHTLGASGTLGFIAGVAGMRGEFIPPTVNFNAPRAGCELDYTPNTAQPRKIQNFCCLAAGFGGANNVIVGSSGAGGSPDSPSATRDVAVTGMGVISAIGLSVEKFAQALREGTCGVSTIDRFSTEGCRASKAGLVKGFDARRMMPTLDFRRMDPGTQYAAVATANAMADAGLLRHPIPAERIGLVVGTSLGAATSFDRFLASVTDMHWEKASVAHFPNMVMSSIGGHISKALTLKGIASTLVGGAGSGLHAFIHAVEMLRRNETQDAVIVVVTDEIAPLFFRMLDRLEMLSTPDCDGGEAIRPYDSNSSVPIIGEGAVAFVLETVDSAASRGARMRTVVSGSGLTADASAMYGAEPSGKWLEQAAKLAFKEAGLSCSEVDVVYGQGNGMQCHDRREVCALARLLNRSGVPVTTVTGNTGLAESASGAFNIAAAILGMECGEAYPIVPGGGMGHELNFVREGTRMGEYHRTLLLGSTENGNNAALILRGVN